MIQDLDTRKFHQIPMQQDFKTSSSNNSRWAGSWSPGDPLTIFSRESYFRISNVMQKFCLFPVNKMFWRRNTQQWCGFIQFALFSNFFSNIRVSFIFSQLIADRIQRRAQSSDNCLLNHFLVIRQQTLALDHENFNCNTLHSSKWVHNLVEQWSTIKSIFKFSVAKATLEIALSISLVGSPLVSS